MLARRKKSTPDQSVKSNEKVDPLTSMLDMLKCINCHEHPRDGKIWIPGSCVHKYCKNCIQKLSSQNCQTCKILMHPKDRMLDDFSTNLLVELRQLQQLEMETSAQDEDSDETAKENLPQDLIDQTTHEITGASGEKSKISRDEPEENSGQKSKTNSRDSGKNSGDKLKKTEPLKLDQNLDDKSSEYLQAMFGLSEEDDDDIEIDPELPALTPHPPSPEKQRRFFNKDKSKAAVCVLLERLDEDANESPRRKSRRQAGQTEDITPLKVTPSSRKSLRRIKSKPADSDNEIEPAVSPQTSRNNSLRRKKSKPIDTDDEIKSTDGPQTPRNNSLGRRKSKPIDTDNESVSTVGTPRKSTRRSKSTVLDLSEDEAPSSVVGTPNSRSSRRSSRQPSVEKIDPKASTSAGKPKGKRLSISRGLSRASSRSGSRDSRTNFTEESDPSATKTKVASPAAADDMDDIYEFKSQSLKQTKKRKNSSKSVTSGQTKQSNFVKPAPRDVSSSNGLKDLVKTSPSPRASTLSKRNAKGETLLHIAVRNGKLDKAKELIESGVDVDAKDFAGWTALHEAICAKNASLETVKFLVESGADVHALGLNNATPLHEASRLSLIEIVKYLLSQSASPALRTSDGKLPTDLANNEAVRKVLSEWDEESSRVNQSQSTQISVQLKVSLEKAIFFFAFNPTKDFLRTSKELFGIKVSQELSKEVTHVIFDAKPKSTVPLSYNYILAVLNGCWMLSNKWLEDSVAIKRFLDPNLFAIGGCQYENIPSTNGGTCASALERARLNRELGNPSLFHGFNFYIYKNSGWAINNEDGGAADEKKGKRKSSAALSGGSCGDGCALSKKDIARIIKIGGGEVINREPNPDMVDPLECPQRFHTALDEHKSKKSPHKLCLTSHVVLYDHKYTPPNKYDMEHVKSLKTDWLIHSAVHFKLLMPDSYLE